MTHGKGRELLKGQGVYSGKNVFSGETTMLSTGWHEQEAGGKDRIRRGEIESYSSQKLRNGLVNSNLRPSKNAKKKKKKINAKIGLRNCNTI